MISQEIIFAGFGGQGILSMGKFIAFAGMNSGLNVSWLPSYGPEMRGGTANCSVIITDGILGSPIVTNADTIVVMNRPSLDKFESYLKSGGLLIMNSDLVNRAPIRDDIELIIVPAQSIAQQLGSKTAANMVLLGALVAKTKIVSMDILLQVIKEQGKENFYDINKRAIEKGIQYT